MNVRISYAGSLIVLIGCIIMLVTHPLETELGGQGQWALVGILMTLGIWIFRPFGVPFSAGAFFFAAYMLDIACYFPTFIILPPILPAIQQAYGIDPLVFAPMLSLGCCAFFMAYQNQWAIMSESIAGARAWRGSHRVAYAAIFFGASIVAMLVAVPAFKGWGLL